VKALKTREGFFAFVGILTQLTKFFLPREYDGVVDMVTTGAASIAASRIYKKTVTPGMTPFKPVPAVVDAIGEQ